MSRHTAALIAVLVVATACGGDHQLTDGTDPNTTVDQDRVLRAYAECIEDNGVDARITEEGAVLFDAGGTLSSRESRELAQTCDERLREMGLIAEPEINEDSLRARYEQLESISECLLERGYPTPELSSLETFIEDHTVQAHPYDYLFADPTLSGADLETILDECPDPGGRIVISD